MNFSAWAIRNPVPPILAFILLTLTGLMAFDRLDVQNFPDMSLPTVSISASRSRLKYRCSIEYRGGRRNSSRRDSNSVRISSSVTGAGGLPESRICSITWIMRRFTTSSPRCRRISRACS